MVSLLLFRMKTSVGARRLAFVTMQGVMYGKAPPSSASTCLSITRLHDSARRRTVSTGALVAREGAACSRSLGAAFELVTVITQGCEPTTYILTYQCRGAGRPATLSGSNEVKWAGDAAALPQKRRRGRWR